jgi:predicted dienelactone hydrolase
MTTLQAGALPVTLVYPTAVHSVRSQFGSFELDVARDAPPSPGRHRLVLLSHGTGGSPLVDHELAAILATAGFVVAQPLHAGDNHQDLSQAGPPSWITRPAEISRAIDVLAADPNWGPMLKLDRVGVHGTSAGGLTALTLAGGRWRIQDMVQHCLAHADEDPGFCFFGRADPAAQAARRASFERARGVPEAMLPAAVTQWQGGGSGVDPRPDPRVAAVTVAVPVAAVLSAPSLAAIRVPVGVISAGRDSLLLPKFHSGHLLAACSACVSLAALPGAGHFDLLAPWPQVLADTLAAQQPRGGRPEPGFDPKARVAAFEQVARFMRETLGD